MIERSTKLTSVAWFSIIVGLFSVSGSGGYLVVTIMGEGPIFFDMGYQVILQFIVSLLIMLGGIGVLLGKPGARNLLLASYGALVLLILMLIGKYATTSLYETREKVIFIVNFLFMLVPIVFALMVLRSAETKAYFQELRS